MAAVAPDGGPICQVCSHDSRLAIEQALISGKSARSVAVNFQIGARPGTDTFSPDHKRVLKHLHDHMGEAYRRAREGREVESGNLIADRLDRLDEVLDEIVARLRQGDVVYHDGLPLLNEDGSYRRRYKDTNLVMAIAEARHNLELRHKLSGALADGPGDAIHQVRQALENPEARKALAALDDAIMQAQGSAPVGSGEQGEA